MTHPPGVQKPTDETTISEQIIRDELQTSSDYHNQFWNIHFKASYTWKWVEQLHRNNSWLLKHQYTMLLASLIWLFNQSLMSPPYSGFGLTNPLGSVIKSDPMFAAMTTRFAFTVFIFLKEPPKNAINSPSGSKTATVGIPFTPKDRMNCMTPVFWISTLANPKSCLKLGSPAICGQIKYCLLNSWYFYPQPRLHKNNSWLALVFKLVHSTASQHKWIFRHEEQIASSLYLQLPVFYPRMADNITAPLFNNNSYQCHRFFYSKYHFNSIPYRVQDMQSCKSCTTQHKSPPPMASQYHWQ